MKMGELRRDAIFSSGTETFVTPLEPEANGEVTLRCRTATKSYLSVCFWFQWGHKSFCAGTKDCVST